MKNSLPNGTLALVSKWRKDDYYTLESNNGETIITGSGKAGLERAVAHAAKNPAVYSHISYECGKAFLVFELDGTARKNSPIYIH